MYIYWPLHLYLRMRLAVSTLTLSGCPCSLLFGSDSLGCSLHRRQLLQRCIRPHVGRKYFDSSQLKEPFGCRSGPKWTTLFGAISNANPLNGFRHNRSERLLSGPIGSVSPKRTSSWSLVCLFALKCDPNEERDRSKWPIRRSVASAKVEAR